MSQVSAAVILTGVTFAPGLDRFQIVAKARITNSQGASLGKQVSIPAMASRHHAIEHIDAAADRVEDIDVLQRHTFVAGTDLV